MVIVLALNPGSKTLDKTLAIMPPLLMLLSSLLVLTTVEYVE
jgi:hypothetical protein